MWHKKHLRKDSWFKDNTISILETENDPDIRITSQETIGTNKHMNSSIQSTQTEPQREKIKQKNKGLQIVDKYPNIYTLI